MNIQVEGVTWSDDNCRLGHKDAKDFINWGMAQDWLYSDFNTKQKKALLQLATSQIWLSEEKPVDTEG